jgi:hypothetical protein
VTSLAFALACALLSARAIAQEEAPAPAADAQPVPVDPRVLQKRADELLDSVADQTVSPYRLHSDAAALFSNVQAQTPDVRVADWKPVERERVDGQLGTVKDMIKTANQRFDAYRLRFNAPPPPDVLDSAGTVEAFDGKGRASFDKTGKMAENQMGVFRYAAGSTSDGIIELNRKMAVLATRIGQAFAYATLVHEGTHARDHQSGELSPERAIDGEINAFRVEYLWLTTMDPTGMRTVVLRSSLNLWLQRHPDDVLTAQSVAYLDHLIDLWNTRGDKSKIKAFVEKLGYEDGDAPPPAKPAAPAPAAPVRA